MRIPVREQLAGLSLLSALVGLTVVAVTIWITEYNRTVVQHGARIEVTAQLKAAQLSSNLALMERSAKSLATRFRLQASLEAYNAGNHSSTDWVATAADLESALSGGPQMFLMTLQAIIYPLNGTSAALNGLLNVTALGVDVPLPYEQNGTRVRLGDPGLGYPPNLYPNLTYSHSNESAFAGQVLNTTSALLIGPWQLNASFALLSITLPVVRNNSSNDILGYMTVILDASLIYDVIDSSVAQGATGTTLLVGPATVNNFFSEPILYYQQPDNKSSAALGDTEVQFVIPPDESQYTPKRHADRAFGTGNPPFKLSSYPAILSALTQNQNALYNAGSNLNAVDEEGYSVAVGFALPQTNLGTWLLVFEQSHDEAWAVISELRVIILACILGTAGGLLFIVYPLAHLFVRPIRRLREATAKSIDPMTYSDDTLEKKTLPLAVAQPVPDDAERASGFKDLKRWFSVQRTPIFRKEKSPRRGDAEPSEGVDGELEPGRRSKASGRSPRIPQKVKDGKHYIHDEVTDLTQTFNEMSDELLQQYTRLEERVRQRTSDLEAAKLQAEAAAESKTLFIANISHELKTPLNGILGIATVAMHEEDPTRLKRHLNTIYESGDLLHKLLTDLLLFSKNQQAHYLTLDEKEFRVRDIVNQLRALFDSQSKDSNIHFEILFEREDTILHGNGRVRDMTIFGDLQRIMQVLINLIGNSLKFTPEEGSVSVRITASQPVVDIVPKRQPSGSFQLPTKPKMTDLKRKTSQASSGRVSSIADADMLDFEFEVKDTGPGIPVHLQERIFEPFVQGDLRLTKKFGGTGLGLSICQQLARLMNGTIELNSQEGDGSTFTFRVPLRHVASCADSTATSTYKVSNKGSMDAISLHSSNQAESPRGESSSPERSAFDVDAKPRLVGLSQPYFSTITPPLSSPNETPKKKGSRVRVLVAEDNVVNQEVVLRMLKLEEIFEVDVAKDGQEALEKVKESMKLNQPYSLIFMDVQMPNLDGRQSTRLIRQTGFTAPIVALTAFADEINQKECMDSGMDYFMPKPIRRPALKHVLKTYCSTINEVDESDGPTPEYERTSRSGASMQQLLEQDELVSPANSSSA